MLWDNTLPAIAGYFAAMLHNPNNVSLQASTSTTPLAMLVGWDLCQMVGYRFRPGLEPWSHMTADGTLANIEATWAMREARFLPMSLRAALRSDHKTGRTLAPAGTIEVTLCTGERRRLLEASSWQLLNVPLDESLALPRRVAALCDLDDPTDVWNMLVPFACNSLGVAALFEQPGEQVAAPVIVTPSTKHYCWPKAAAISGLGSSHLLNVHVDADARLDIDRLDDTLSSCLKRRAPVILLVAVCGSTEESAVDPIAEVLALREHHRSKGLDFPVHVDAAWGGYMLSSIRRNYRFQVAPQEAQSGPCLETDDIFIDDLRHVPTSDYVIRQLKHIRDCDAATIDPHKWGYVPYPAGSILYRNGEIRCLTTFSGLYIGESGSVKVDTPNTGVFGLEGSRPGAAAASVFMSHRCIRPSVSGHGQLINECMFNTVLFYARLLCMNDDDLNFVVVPLPRLPAEKNQSDVGQQIEFIRERIVGRNTDALRADSEAMALLKELGPDQNILDYAFNLRLPDGVVNPDGELCNALNDSIFDQFHLAFERRRPIEQCRFLVSKTAFRRADYGDRFVTTFASRLGLEDGADNLTCLRSVIMDPYITHTTDGSYFAEIANIIRETVAHSAAQLQTRIP
jgi:glutamate/tyrosine decarboxylase-like PLP-dependent enzyme